MGEYIPRQDVVQIIRKWSDGYDYVELPTANAIADIQTIPAADVRPVVLCKECRHSRKPDRSSLAEFAVYEGVLICTAGFEHVYPTLSSDIFVLEESFCSVGERGDAE